MSLFDKILTQLGMYDEEEYYDDEIEEIKPLSKDAKGKNDATDKEGKPSILNRASGLFKNKKADDKEEKAVADEVKAEPAAVKAPKEEKEPMFARKTETVRSSAAPRKSSFDFKTDRQETGKFGSKSMSIPVENKMVNVVVIEPVDFNEDAPKIGNYLRSNRPVIVNFTNTDRVMAARMTDFISGTIYALNGNMKKISRDILVCAPKNVDIDSDNDFISNRGENAWKN